MVRQLAEVITPHVRASSAGNRSPVLTDFGTRDRKNFRAVDGSHHLSATCADAVLKQLCLVKT